MISLSEVTNWLFVYFSLSKCYEKMMKSSRKPIFFLLVISFAFILPSNAQTQLPSPPVTINDYWGPVVLSHYTPVQLAIIKNNDTTKYNTILYYYQQSFIIEPIACSDCILKPLDEVDVSEFEKFRMQSTRFVREYDKYGFRITLLSIDELLYRLPMHN